MPLKKQDITIKRVVGGLFGAFIGILPLFIAGIPDATDDKGVYLLITVFGTIWFMFQGARIGVSIIDNYEKSPLSSSFGIFSSIFIWYILWWSPHNASKAGELWIFLDIPMFLFSIYTGSKYSRQMAAVVVRGAIVGVVFGGTFLAAVFLFSLTTMDRMYEKIINIISLSIFIAVLSSGYLFIAEEERKNKILLKNKS